MKRVKKAARLSRAAVAIFRAFRLRRHASYYDLSTLDYNCPGSTSFSLGGKLASYFSNSSGFRSVTK